MIAELTIELGELLAAATGLPVSIDPIRPPSIPGGFVGPPSINPEPELGGRVLVVQWETGLLVTAATGAWSLAAAYGEAVVSAVTAHPTLGLVGARSVLYPQGDAGDAPGYRVDVAVLVHTEDLPPVPTPAGELLDELTEPERISS